MKNYTMNGLRAFPIVIFFKKIINYDHPRVINLASNTLISGSYDKNIKIIDVEKKEIMLNLGYFKKDCFYYLYYVIYQF